MHDFTMFIFDFSIEVTMKQHILLIAVAAVTTGCAQQTFVISEEVSELTKENSHHFLVNGIGQTCDTHISQFSLYTSF